MPHFKLPPPNTLMVKLLSSAIPFWKAKSHAKMMVLLKIPDPGIYRPISRDKVDVLPGKNGQFRE